MFVKIFSQNAENATVGTSTQQRKIVALSRSVQSEATEELTLKRKSYEEEQPNQHPKERERAKKVRTKSPGKRAKKSIFCHAWQESREATG